MSSRVVLSTSRPDETRKIRKRKGTSWVYKTNCHEQEKRVGVAHPLSVAVAGRGLDDPSRQAFTRPFHPLPECSASGLPPRFDTALKVILPPLSYLPVVVPSLPATVVPAEKDSLPPSEGLFRAFADENNKANTSYALYYRVCLAQRCNGAWDYKFLTRTERRSVKPGEAVTKLEITVLSAVTRLKVITSDYSRKIWEVTFEYLLFWIFDLFTSSAAYSATIGFLKMNVL